MKCYCSVLKGWHSVICEFLKMPTTRQQFARGCVHRQLGGASQLHIAKVCL